MCTYLDTFLCWDNDKSRLLYIIMYVLDLYIITYYEVKYVYWILINIHIIYLYNMLFPTQNTIEWLRNLNWSFFFFLKLRSEKTRKWICRSVVYSRCAVFFLTEHCIICVEFKFNDKTLNMIKTKITIFLVDITYVLYTIRIFYYMYLRIFIFILVINFFY